MHNAVGAKSNFEGFTRLQVAAGSSASTRRQSHQAVQAHVPVTAIGCSVTQRAYQTGKHIALQQPVRPSRNPLLDTGMSLTLSCCLTKH